MARFLDVPGGGRSEAYAEPVPEVLVVAPLAAELAGLLRRSGARRVSEPHRRRAARVHRGRIGEHPFVAAVIGDGPARARSALEELVGRYRPRRALLVGVAGALSPDLGIGALVRAENVVEVAEGEERWIAGGAGKSGGTAVSVSRIVTTAEEKEALWRRLGEPRRCVVDLESAVFVGAMERCGAAWMVVRAVSDTADEDLPAELLGASDAEGHVSRLGVLSRVAVRPWRLTRLWALRRRLARASESLEGAAAGWVLGEEGHR